MIHNEVDFDKLSFSDERPDFEKYIKSKGVYLHKQVYDVLLSFNSETVTYAELSSVIRYDKNLRDTLYVYLATFEESLRAELFDKYDVDDMKITYRGITGLKKLNNTIVEKTDNSISNLYYCYELELGPTIDLFEFLKIRSEDQIKELRQIKDLRNSVMHHNILVLGRSTNKNDAEDNINKLRRQITLLCKHLSSDYQRGFQNDISQLNINHKTGKPYLDKLFLGEIKWII